MGRAACAALSFAKQKEAASDLPDDVPHSPAQIGEM
jgi:hypothetical protein